MESSNDLSNFKPERLEVLEQAMSLVKEYNFFSLHEYELMLKEEEPTHEWPAEELQILLQSVTGRWVEIKQASTTYEEYLYLTGINQDINKDILEKVIKDINGMGLYEAQACWDYLFVDGYSCRFNSTEDKPENGVYIYIDPLREALKKRIDELKGEDLRSASDILKQEHCVYVEQTMTQPKRANKQPRPVWVVTGNVEGLKDFFYELGGRKYRGKFSFWEDPSDAILGYLQEQGRMSFSEQQEREEQLARDRSQRYRDRARKREDESKTYYQASSAAVEGIPMGQPILVGHHSEKRHRAALNRYHSNMSKSVEAGEKADYWRGRAASAEHSMDKKNDVAFAKRRLDEAKADKRRYQRALESSPDSKRWQNLFEQVEDKIAYWEQQIEELGGIQFSPENVKKGQQLFYRHGWYPVVRVNKKSVTVGNWHGGKGTWKVPYEEIRQVRD